MAKAKKSSSSTKKLAGQKVALAGKFGYKDWWRKDVLAWAKAADVNIVNVTGTFDILVVGEGRGGNPPGEVAKVRKRLPAVQELTLAEFTQLLFPEPEEFIRELREGKGHDRTDWDALEMMFRIAGVRLDLTGANLRKADLSSAKLEGTNLNEADLREANVEFTHFDDLREANFDKAKARIVYLKNLEGCTFRNAKLHKARFFYGNSQKVTNCDFSGAELTRARGSRGTFTNCKFGDVDLSDAELDSAVFDACDFSSANLSRIHAHKVQFTSANFSKANLQYADLRETSLKNADLRNANLRNAILGGADLTGANVAGADFAGAVLTDAKIKGVDFSKAKNYIPPVARVAGPKIKEFAKAAAGAKDFDTSAEVELGEGEHARMGIVVRYYGGRAHLTAASRYHREGDDVHDWITAPTLEQGLLNMADRWPTGQLRLDTVQAKGSKTVRGAKLQELAVAAWAEAFGVQLTSPEDLLAQKDAQKANALRERDDLMAKIRAKGVGVWNAIEYGERHRIDLHGADLSGAKLAKLSLTSRKDLQAINFSGATLTGAQLWNCVLGEANFAKAKLRDSDLQNSKCEKASFVGADLTNANLSNTKLHGADFTDANLTGTNFDKAQFDSDTKFPKSFTPSEGMVWKGTGTRPGQHAVKAAPPGSMNFDNFIKDLNAKIDASRIKKAGAMLKAEKFQLFADVTDAAVMGVVKSQTSGDLLYSCRLASDGQFYCGTQNVKPCGGLQGSLCKHLLVLVIGLAKAGKLDPATVNNWANTSKAQRPVLDKDLLSDTFLKYKGAEAGTVDWRPTETIPEDYYAM